MFLSNIYFESMRRLYALGESGYNARRKWAVSSVGRAGDF